MGCGCVWGGVLSGDGGWRSRWEPDDNVLKGLGEEVMLSPVGAGRKIFKTGQ